MNRMKFLFFGVVSVYLQAMSFAAEGSQYIPSSIGPKDRESYARMLNYSIGSQVDLSYSIREINTEEGKKVAEEVRRAGYINMPRNKLQSMLQCNLSKLLEINEQNFVMWQIGRKALIDEIGLAAKQWLYDELTKREYTQSPAIKRKYESRLRKFKQQTYKRESSVYDLLVRLNLATPERVGYSGKDESKILAMREMCSRALIKHIGRSEDPSSGQYVFMTLELFGNTSLEDFALGRLKENAEKECIPYCDRFDEFKANMLQAMLTALVDEDGEKQRKHLARILVLVNHAILNPIDPLRRMQIWVNETNATLQCMLPQGPYIDPYHTKLDLAEIVKIRDAYENDTDYGFFTSKDAVQKVIFSEFYAPALNPQAVISILCDAGTSPKYGNIAELLHYTVEDLIEVYELAATDHGQETVERYANYQDYIGKRLSYTTAEN